MLVDSACMDQSGRFGNHAWFWRESLCR